MKKIVASAIVIFFIFSVGLSYYFWKGYINEPLSSQSEEVIYEIPPGTSFKSVAQDLEEKRIIKNSHFFTLLAKIKRLGNKMKVGEYALNKNMSPVEILNVISSGKSIERKITISEGLSIFEIAEIFEGLGLTTKEEFLKIVTDKEFIQKLLGEDLELQSEKIESLEGYLFPETYTFTKYTQIKSIIEEMVRQFKKIYEEVKIQSEIKDLTKHQVVTLASIVEKETGAPEERPLIASVFHNRLRKKMRLQTDPTIIYGKAIQSKKIEINITKSDLSSPTLYNTYIIPALPPGPIANPGREALLATFKPAISNYLFFVSKNEGRHYFSEDFKDHQNAVKKFQLDKNARDGKSWRDLKK